MTAKAVFDCMLFLQAATSRVDPASACFRLVDGDRLTLFLSRDILAEVREVLNRPKVRRKFPILTEEFVDAFLEWAEAKGTVLDEIPEVYQLARDPDDEPYLNLAIAAQVQYLVSRDHDLLDLMNDPEFRSQHSDLLIIDPVALLRLFRATSRGKPSTDV